MNKDKEKLKVGRPKLADSKTKKESMLVCVFVFIVAAAIAVLAFNILKAELNPKYIVGNIYNTHVNSCIIENDTIDCGPNVTYMKYKINNDDYTEVNKEKDSIEIKLGSYNKIKFCYKTNNTDLRCNK